MCASSLDKLWSDDKDDKNEKYTGQMPDDLQVLYQIACGLACIHSKDIIHRDIKPHNILISLPDALGSVRMKVADFGCAKPTTPTGSCSLSNGNGTALYHSPEMIAFERNNDRNKKPRISNKTDVFSAGIVFFQFLTRGVHPFGIVGDAMLPSNINNGNPVKFKGTVYRYCIIVNTIFMLSCFVYPKELLAPNLQNPVLKLIGKMINTEPENRPTMEEVKEELYNLQENKNYTEMQTILNIFRDN